MAELPEPYCNAVRIPLSECADIDNVDNEGTFYIKAEFEFLRRAVEEEEEEDMGVEDMKVEVREVELFLPRDLLLDESRGQLTLTDILHATKVPPRDHRLITEEILSCARSMASDYPSRAGVLPMSVFISCCLEDGQELDAPVVPSSIEIGTYFLKKVEGESGTCPICLDEIPSGSDAASLPCSHVYHDRCVFNWLLKNGTCPLCRSEI